VALSYRGADSLLTARNANDGNLVIGYLMLGWPFAVLGARVGRPSFLPALCVAFLAATVLLFSRGGLVLVPLLVLLSVLAFVRRPLAALGLLGSVAAGSAFLWFVVGPQIDLLSAWKLRGNATELDVTSVWRAIATFQDQLAASGRTEIWGVAERIFRQNPLTGAGYNSFEALGQQYAEAHSLLFQTLAERGLVGAVILYGLLGRWMTGAIRLLWSQDGLGAMRVVQLGSVVCWLVYTHAVGSGLVVTSAGGFMVNVLGAMLLAITISGDHLVASVARAA
jgi:O-antigen ligase